jgi:hypothetical protein
VKGKAFVAYRFLERRRSGFQRIQALMRPEMRPQERFGFGLR